MPLPQESSPLITYTLFEDRFAQTKSERADTAWSDLVGRIKNAPTYLEKNACPLISLAEYGELRSDKNSLRHAANVIRVHGIELDYDGEQVALSIAASRLQDAALEAVLYTSPSHKPNAPRWRALLPLSEAASPERREEYVARANRALGGIVTRESFTLSQSFYIGRVRGAEYEVIEVHGRPVDLAQDLEPQFHVDARSTGASNRDVTTDAQLRAAFTNGEDRYQAMLKLSSRWAARGMAGDDIETNLLELLGANSLNGDGIDLATRARPMADSAVRKFGETRAPRIAAPLEPAFDPGEPPAMDLPPLEELIGEAPASDKPVRKPMDWDLLDAGAPPDRDWAVEYWLPMGHTALCAGLGGLGKTLLMQTMATCMAIAYEYVDIIAKPRRVLFWAGEDEQDELWRRQIAICQWLGIPLSSLKGKLILESYFARDITLAGIGYGALASTGMMTELREQIGDYQADYVVLDSTARVFGGNENDRHQVTTFISWLAAACQITGAGLCLIGHPGKGDGSEYSGSTAWEGSVRSRLYLSPKLPGAQSKSEEGDEQCPDEANLRFLSRRKANYAATDWRKLTYERGVLIPDNVQRQQARRTISPEFAQEAVLRAVRALKVMGQFGTPATASPLYLPRLAKQYDLLEGMSPNTFGTRMRELMKAGKLKSAQVGTYSNRTPRMGLIEA